MIIFNIAESINVFLEYLEVFILFLILPNNNLFYFI